MAKYLVRYKTKNNTLADARYVGTFKRGDKEYYKVAHMNITYYGSKQCNNIHPELEIPKNVVVGLIRIPSKFEKKVKKFFNSIIHNWGRRVVWQYCQIIFVWKMVLLAKTLPSF